MNYKAGIIAALVAGVIAGMAVGLLGDSMGIPPGWRSMISGGIAGATGAIFLTRKKPAEPDEQ